MKKLIYILIAVFAVTVACESDEVTINTINASEADLIAAELDVPATNTFEVIRTTDLVQGNEAADAVTYTWSKASGDNDGAIMYYLQLDVAGNDFATAVTIPLAQEGTSELSRTLTFGDLNKAVNKISSNLFAIASPLSINFEDVNNMEIRVESILGVSIAKAYSQPIPLTVKAYFSGLTNDLVVSGAALNEDVIITIADGVYKGRLNLTQNTFRFFAQPADTNVSYNYEYFESDGYTIDPLLENANDEKMNFKFTGAEGPWDIFIDTNLKSITLVEVTIPDNLYIVGNNTSPEWNPAISPEMNLVSEGVFVLVIELQGVSDGFKFIPTNASFDGDWGEDPANPGHIIQDGEQNLTGYEAGKYLVTVDYNTLTYKVTVVNSLNVVGSINGWNSTTATPMVEASLGIYSIVLDLPVGAEFKFIPTTASFEGDWGADAANAGRIIQDGEANLSGYEAGKYVVAVNYNTMSFTVSKISAIPTNLYLVGDHNGWNNATANQLTNVSSGVFSITLNLSAGNGFKFLPTQGSWDGDFGENKLIPQTLVQNDEQNLSVAADGSYKITVDFNNGNFSVVLQ
ncbi:MAG: SusF/SusE family outer membrane protein [Flavobacteriaceae bacterium]|nr:SusF/SusE family outer membrane protein [Flavobacteriaceae bacterium]